MSKTGGKKINEPIYPPRPAQYSNGPRQLMWAGIIFFLIIILFVWMWNFKEQISYISQTGLPEKGFIEETRKNWQRAFNSVNGEYLDPRTQVEKKLTEILHREAVTEVSTSTATTTQN